ncbi:hypothetical protein SAMN05443575_1334 [Jatrophihabitans endophyticus]|uniref:Uncharacterized protein n=1 Tax=Jatrophihabitans endophyticus TaxID=1206085 RepID=A0A1M5GYK2_9ACTN|nr:hypothetical protein [Jatrophihabitans endophyticus]SHG08790.1 hypothetical protein SAMN05443575_1334 [Jatrophihabitans endophyticus]
MTVDDAVAAAEQADQEAREAEALVVEFEQRLEAGDETITAEQLDEQSRISRFARLRATGAATKRAAAERALAVERAQETIEQVASIDTSDAELVQAWAAAVDALRTLAKRATARSATIWHNSNELVAADVRLQRAGAEALSTFGVLGAMYGGETGYRIPDRGINVSDVAPAVLIATAVEAGVVGEVRDFSSITLTSSRQLAGSTLTGRVGGWDAAARGVLTGEGARA